MRSVRPAGMILNQGFLDFKLCESYEEGLLLSSNFGILHSISLHRCEIKMKSFMPELNFSDTVPTHHAVDQKFHLQHGTKKPICS